MKINLLALAMTFAYFLLGFGLIVAFANFVDGYAVPAGSITGIIFLFVLGMSLTDVYIHICKSLEDRP